MFRSHLRKSVSRIRVHLPKRTIGTFQPGFTNLPRIRALGPIVWSVSAIGVIYLGCAANEIRKDVKDIKSGPRYRGQTITFEMMERARDIYWKHPELSIRPGKFGSDVTEPTKVVMAIIGANIGLFGVSQISPEMWTRLAHYPAGARNFTLLTSMFGHSGLLHLGLNMYGLFNFAPPVAVTPTFQRSGSHLTAFYLSTGIAASLANHLAAIWPNKSHRLGMSLGASGGIMAILGAFAMSYPDSEIGIILIPGGLPAQQALLGLIAFETYGLFVGFKAINFAHAAHLGGVLAGAAYIHFDGRKHLWIPARRFAFNQMQRLNMI